jgi:hypothetical protein
VLGGVRLMHHSDNFLRNGFWIPQWGRWNFEIKGIEVIDQFVPVIEVFFDPGLR